MKRFVLLIALVAFSRSWASGGTPSSGNQLKLIPQPKEVQIRDGSFRVRAATKILVEFGHQQEDRIAAETLAEEIHDQSGLNVGIIGSREKGKQHRSTIELARLQDKSVRRFLEAKGLKADSIGDQGYLLFSDKTRLIVAANTGQGLFYGVQTLRQLLHREGSALVCPAVSIRDWPSLDWNAFQNQDDAGRVGNDLDEITAINARLEDLRDAATRLNGMYCEAWLREYRQLLCRV